MNTSLESTMLEFGIDWRNVDLHFVDHWQRLPTQDKPRKRNGAVKVLPDGAVLIQNWASGEKTCWHPDKRSDVACLSQHRRIQNDQRAIARKATRKRQSDASALARRIWDHAKPAQADHPYLQRKKLPATLLKETDVVNGWKNRWLLIPLYSESNPIEIINLECIDPHGLKRPVKGALRRAVWGFAGLGMPDRTVVIAEGYSTAAALSVSLNMPIVFAVGAGNVPRVTEIWRAMSPWARIVLAGDHDPAGEAAIQKAGQLSDVTYLVPADFNDWADVFAAEGPQEIVRHFREYLN